MNAFFQWIYGWFSPRKKSIEQEPVQTSENTPAAPIDDTHQEIELTCHQIEQSIESICSSMRNDKSNSAKQLSDCKKLIKHLDSIMSTAQYLSADNNAL
jgi:hypothetical protein